MPDRIVTWLHLSDLHCRPGTDAWESEGIFDKLLQDLKTVSETHRLHPDVIFFTGDLAFGHEGNQDGHRIGDQFETAAERLNKIRGSFTPTVRAEDVFVVPGNHDVNRSLVSYFVTEWLGRPERKLFEITKLVQTGGRDWEFCAERLKDYREFLGSGDYKHLLGDPGRGVLGDPDRLIYAANRTCESGVRLTVFGLNTAWSCNKSPEKGNLWMGAGWQIGQLRNIARKMPTDLVVALGHHPVNHLNEEDEQGFRQAIPGWAHFHLHGHEHTSYPEVVDNYIRMSAGALYQTQDKPMAYSFVRTNLDTCTTDVWLRCWERRGGGGWVPDHIPGKSSADGVARVKTLFPPPPPPPPPDEEVLQRALRAIWDESKSRGLVLSRADVKGILACKLQLDLSQAQDCMDALIGSKQLVAVPGGVSLSQRAREAVGRGQK